MYSFRGFICYVQQLMRACPNKLFLGKVAGIAIYKGTIDKVRISQRTQNLGKYHNVVKLQSWVH